MKRSRGDFAVEVSREYDIDGVEVGKREQLGVVGESGHSQVFRRCLPRGLGFRAYGHNFEITGLGDSCCVMLAPGSIADQADLHR